MQKLPHTAKKSGISKKIVFDTNVLVSAIAFGGQPRKAVLMTEESLHKIYLPAYALHEVRDVLARPKFKRYWPLERIITRVMAQGAVIIPMPDNPPPQILEDRDDDY